MQSAETVLTVIRERGRQGLPLERLYRQLFSRELFLLAYGRIYSNDGAMTPGVTPETADDMSLAKIETIIGALRAESYRWSAARRVYIPKKGLFDQEASVGHADVVGQAGGRGGAHATRRVLRPPVFRALPWVSTWSGVSHRAR